MGFGIFGGGGSSATTKDEQNILDTSINASGLGDVEGNYTAPISQDFEGVTLNEGASVTIETLDPGGFALAEQALNFGGNVVGSAFGFGENVAGDSFDLAESALDKSFEQSQEFTDSLQGFTVLQSQTFRDSLAKINENLAANYTQGSSEVIKNVTQFGIAVAFFFALTKI